MKRREAREQARAKADRTHDRYVQRTYGLEPGEYARRLAEQDGRCALCQRQARRRRLAVDHDHETGEVRWLLCYNCNHFILGWLEFDPIACHNASVIFGILAARHGDTFVPVPVSGMEPSTVQPPE